MEHLPSIYDVIRYIGYPGLFTMIYLESGVFFGFFLPGASVLFTAGLLASQGFFNVWILVPMLFIAAILGDSTGYWFGAKIGVRLFLRPDSKFFRHEHLEYAKSFYDQHGTKAIFLARFIPIARTFAPIVAGIVGMQYRTFLIYNVLGALTWAAGISFAGYYLGSRFPGTEEYLGYIILGIIGVTCIPIVMDGIKRFRALT